jgi:serine/threonine-protein kinase RsbW
LTTMNKIDNFAKVNTIFMNLENQLPMDFELTLPADLSNLHQIREFIQDAARHFCDEDQFVYDIELAVDELVTNVIIHGYHGEHGLIKIIANGSPGQFEIRIIDDASPFDPTLLEDPDLQIPLEERRIGGLGVYMAKVLTDEMSYKRLPGNMNEVKLVKRCPELREKAFEE